MQNLPLTSGHEVFFLVGLKRIDSLDTFWEELRTASLSLGFTVSYRKECMPEWEVNAPYTQ